MAIVMIVTHTPGSEASSELRLGNSTMQSFILLRSTLLIMVMPIVVLMLFLGFMITNWDLMRVKGFVAEGRVGLEDEYVSEVEWWLESLSGLTDKPLQLNGPPRRDRINVYTERQHGKIFHHSHDAVYLPGAQAIILSRGIIELGTAHGTGTGIGSAEDTVGYQLFIFVLLHEIGHSQLHSASSGVFGISGSCSSRTAFEFEADEFAAKHVLDAPFGFTIYYRAPVFNDVEVPSPAPESDDAHAMLKFFLLLEQGWKNIQFPEASDEFSQQHRLEHLNQFFSRMAEEVESRIEWEN